jgi:intracellular multiplication protein IcmE
MANNDDDMISGFDDGPNGDDLVMDDLEQRTTLADLWRNNPMVKVAAVLGVLAVVIGALVLFGGGEEAPPESLVTTPASDLKEAPGTKEVSPAYADAVGQENDARIEDALRSGTSAFPTPLTPPTGMPAPGMETETDDPLARWREAQDQAAAVAPPTTAAVAVDPNAEAARQNALNELANAMSAQMNKILETREPGRIQAMTVTSIETRMDAQGNPVGGGFGALGGPLTGLGANGSFLPASAQAQQQQGFAPTQIKVMLSAGTIEYGQLLLEANTDVPGPVLAQIVTGPFAGGRVIGSFTNTETHIVLNFNTLVKDGVNYPINAVAVDPETTLPGMVTEIDHRYFKRVILPAAARFVEGMGQAIAESGSSTTVVIDGDTTVEEDNSEIDTREELYAGVEEGASEAAEFLEEEGDDTEPMIRVKAGAPLGIFFTQPVTQQLDAEGNPIQNAFYPGGTYPGGVPGQQQQQGLLPGMPFFGAGQQQMPGYYPYGGGQAGMGVGTGYGSPFGGVGAFQPFAGYQQPTTGTTTGTTAGTTTSSTDDDN